MDVLNLIARNVAASESWKCWIVCGTAGIGKSRAFKTALDAANRPWRLIKRATKLGLCEELQECARLGITALIDDADSMWLDLAMLQILMTATAPRNEGRRIYTYPTMKYKKTYCFDGLVVVIISNIDVKDVNNFPTRLRPSVKALTSRAKPIMFFAENDAIYEYTCYLAVVENMLARANYTIEEANDALRYFACNRHRMDDVSPRSLLDFAMERKASPGRWRDVADRTPNPGGPLEVPDEDVPRIYPRVHPGPSLVEERPTFKVVSDPSTGSTPAS